jgi:phosphoribosylformylglycinamidine synthase subunit PurL
MLIIVHRGREKEVQQIFDKWDLPWSEVGFVTDTGRMVVKHHGKVVADIPAAKLANDAPVYQREFREPAYLKTVRAFTLANIPDFAQVGTAVPSRPPADHPITALQKLLAWPSIASKNWVYRQYDHMVRDGTIVPPGSDAAVVHIKNDSLPEAGRASDSSKNGGARLLPSSPAGEQISKFIALTVDCNATYVYLDPYEGGKIAVAEACRNLACTGAVPLGATDNLNFGNPHNPEIFYQLRKSVEGLAEACRVFEAPVTGGNVSLYNQNPSGPIDPTPTVAVVGQIAKREHITAQYFKDEGDVIILLGDLVDTADPLQGLGGSAYLQVIHKQKTGTPPRIDLAAEKRLHDNVRSLITAGLVKSAHDCSEGGFLVALAECCISNQVARETPRLIGATVELSPGQGARLDAALFGETQSRIIISVSPENAERVLGMARQAGVPAARLGIVGGQNLSVAVAGGEKLVASTTELHDAWFHAIARAMQV